MDYFLFRVNLKLWLRYCKTNYKNSIIITLLTTGTQPSVLTGIPFWVTVANEDFFKPWKLSKKPIFDVFKL